jgi:hypothetical protein
MSFVVSSQQDLIHIEYIVEWAGQM